MMHKSVMTLVLCGFCSADALADVVYDTFCMNYHNGSANVCGGEELYGRELNVQSADAFDLPQDTLVVEVAADYVIRNGSTPDGVCVSFFEPIGDSCLAQEGFFHFQTIPLENIVVEHIGEYFGYPASRLTVSLPVAVHLPEGRWFVCVQPVASDFFWQLVGVADDCTDEICDVNFRDGLDDNPCCDGEGFGFPNWDCCHLFEWNSLAFRIAGLEMGGCNGGEIVKARCRVHNENGNVTVKVRRATPVETLTAELDAPLGVTQPIPIGADGRGKTRFRNVSPGPHTATVCAKTVDVACNP